MRAVEQTVSPSPPGAPFADGRGAQVETCRALWDLALAARPISPEQAFLAALLVDVEDDAARVRADSGLG